MIADRLEASAGTVFTIRWLSYQTVEPTWEVFNSSPD